MANPSEINEQIKVPEREMERVGCLLCGSIEMHNVCKAQDLNYGVPGNFLINKCIACNFCYLSPRFTLKNIIKAYPEKYTRDYIDGLLTDETMLAARLKFLKKLSKPANLILDVGCSYGDFLDLLKKNGFNVLGIEPGESSKEAKKKIPGKIFDMPVRDADIAYGTVDVVTLWGVIEHLYTPLEDIERLFLFLKPGGKIVIETPNFDTWESKLWGKYWYALEPPRHVGFFSIKTALKLLEDIGFEVLSVNAEPRSVWMEVSFIHFMKSRKIFSGFLGKKLIAVFNSLFSKLLFKLLANFFCAFGQGGDIVIVARKPRDITCK